MSMNLKRNSFIIFSIKGHSCSPRTCGAKTRVSSTVVERGIECSKPVDFLFSGILDSSHRGADPWVLFSYSAVGVMHHGSDYSHE